MHGLRRECAVDLEVETFQKMNIAFLNHTGFAINERKSFQPRYSSGRLEKLRSELRSRDIGGSWRMDLDSDATIDEMVSRFRELSRKHPGEIEFEIRLGSHANQTFFPGVPRGVFHQLEQDMCEDCRLVTNETWSEVIDYHYMGMDGSPIRTRVIADSQRMLLKKEHTKKVVLQKALISRDDGSDDVARITLSHEMPVPDPPSCCVPTHVRIQQRRTFTDIRDNASVWAYELSKTWSANSRSAVEHKQHMNEPIFEVECELIDEKGVYLMDRTDEQVGRSLLLKTKCLFGKDAMSKLVVTRENIPIPSEIGKGKLKRQKRKL